jgi:uncharacterized membrane protein YkvA (DUF1232 family)
VSGWAWVLVGLAAFVVLYGIGVTALIVRGRRSDAVALARFIPDCLVLCRRLATDPRVPPRARVVLALVVAYLALPFDLVPDMIPVAGQLDDALVLALGLRLVLRAAGADVISENWPGPSGSLRVLLRIAGGTPGR